MKLLLLNANTTAAMTERMVDRARALAGPDARIDGATGRFGAAYISTRAAVAVAGHAALDLVAEHVGRDNPKSYDAVLLACFGDPGLLALKELSPIPVLGMAEASLGIARALGQRVGLITGGSRWIPMLNELALVLGHASHLVAVRATPLTGAEIAADPDGASASLAALVRRCVDDDGADVVILGGAGLVGLAERLQPVVGVPLLDSLACLVQAGTAAARLAAAKPQSGSFSPPPRTTSVGLSSHLTASL